MGRLTDAKIGTTVTVTKVKGNFRFKKKLEEFGIMAGSDLKILNIFEGSDRLTVHCGGREIQLEMTDASSVIVTEHFCRHNDPVLLGGCCAYGNTGDLIDRIEERQV